MQGYGQGGGGYPPGGGGYPPGGGAPPGYGPPQQGGYGPPSGQQGYGAPPPGAMGGVNSGGYEFNQAENAQIAKLASRLTASGVVMLIWGSLQILGGWAFGLPNWIMGFVGAVALIAMGALFLGAGSSFKSITTTQGNDIGHLMQAVNKLSTAALVQLIGYIVTAVLTILIGVLVVFIFAIAVASR